MSLYEILNNRKLNGEELELDDITPVLLKQLFIDEEISDRLIADLFGVKSYKITYRRKKYGISIANAILDEYFSGGITDESKTLNQESKEKILKKENINLIARAITHFAFRNGPIENMHAHPNNQLSENDMKTLNKFMVNRIAYIITLMIEERWTEFDYLINFNGIYGQDWDVAIPDDGGTRKIIELLIKDYKYSK